MQVCVWTFYFEHPVYPPGYRYHNFNNVKLKFLERSNKFGCLSIYPSRLLENDNN